MADHFEEVTTTSWGERVGNSFLGPIIGFCFFIASFFVLIWNENRSLEVMQTLDEGRHILVSVSPDSIDPQNNGKLVYFTGPADTEETLRDTTFGIREHALRLKRTVKIFQWREYTSEETHDNFGGSQTTTKSIDYKKVWQEGLINSAEFKHPEGHRNPMTVPYYSQDFTASDIHVRSFRLARDLSDKIDTFVQYPATSQTYSAMPASISRNFTMYGDKYYMGDPTNMKVGDLQVEFSVIRPMDISVIGMQKNNAVEAYTAKHGEIAIVSAGNISSDKLFDKEENKNRLETWGWRGGGFLMMWFGLMALFSPITAVSSVIPLLGSIVGAGISFSMLPIALGLSLGTIAITWAFIRPLAGITIFIAAIAAFLIFVPTKKKMPRSESS